MRADCLVSLLSPPAHISEAKLDSLWLLYLPANSFFNMTSSWPGNTRIAHTRITWLSLRVGRLPLVPYRAIYPSLLSIASQAHAHVQHKGYLGNSRGSRAVRTRLQLTAAYLTLAREFLLCIAVRSGYKPEKGEKDSDSSENMLSALSFSSRWRSSSEKTFVWKILFACVQVFYFKENLCSSQNPCNKLRDSREDEVLKSAHLKPGAVPRNFSSLPRYLYKSPASESPRPMTSISTSTRLQLEYS